MRAASVCLFAVVCVAGLLSAVGPVMAQAGPDVPIGTLPSCLVPAQPSDPASATSPSLGGLFGLSWRSLVLVPAMWPSLSGGPISPRARSAVLREPRRDLQWVTRGSVARLVRR